jgi:hypothetical protein
MNDASIPAGWYPDPQATDRNRYWDGQAWTAATTLRQDATPPASSGHPAPGVPGSATSPPVASPWSQVPSGDAQAPGWATPPAGEQPQPSGAAPPAWSGFPAAPVSSAPVWANGRSQTPAWSQQGYGPGAGGTTSRAPGLPAYYDQAFATIDRGQTKVVWNWAAFVLGALWYLYRGMWVKAILYVAVVVLSGGFLAIPVWIYGGLMGTHDLWLLHRKGTQGW